MKGIRSSFYASTGIFFDMDGTLNRWRWIPVEEVKKEGYFRTVAPHENVIGAAKLLKRRGISVGVYSAAWQDGHSREDKNIWLDEHAPFIANRDRMFVPCGAEKASYFRRLIGRDITKGDVLLDDNSDVLRSWEAFGGTGVKIRTPENGHFGTWQGASISVDSSPEEIEAYLFTIWLQSVGFHFQMESKLVQ